MAGVFGRAALTKIFSADEIKTDPAGRIMYSADGGATFATIDAPLENLALFQYLMTTPGGTAGGWLDVTDNWDDIFFALLGDGGPDDVDGGNGEDYVFGGGGPDNLNGGNGNDIMIGCMGPDLLTGGRGADTFVFRSASEAPAHHQGEDDDHHETGDHAAPDHDGCGGSSGSDGQETITDFEIGKDVIDLGALETVAGFSDDPAIHQAWAVQDGDNTMLYVDTNGSLKGDHPAEMGILLLDVEATSLTSDDFLF